MKQSIEHRLVAEIHNNMPALKIGIRFNDIYSHDTYVLVNESEKSPYTQKSMHFTLFKNNKNIGKYIMANNNVIELISEAFKNIDDYDLHQHLNDTVKAEIAESVTEFLNHYEKTVLLNEVTIEGELRRMHEVAGINKLPLV